VRNAIPYAAIVIALTAVPAAAQAQRFEDVAGLEAIVVARLGAGIGQAGGPVAPIDRRLKLAACPDTPAIEGPAMGAAVVRCAALGWRIRVPLRVNAAASASQRTATLVRKGDPVELVAGGASFTVSTQMIADEDGAQGEMIRVRADRSAAPIVARVVDVGLVSVPGFN
jgi:flagella basal body P-ring formation protein FlgA